MSKQKLFIKDFTLVLIGQIISLFGNAHTALCSSVVSAAADGFFHSVRYRYGVFLSSDDIAFACRRCDRGQGEQTKYYGCARFYDGWNYSRILSVIRSFAARTAFDCRFDVVIRYRGRISACGASEYSRSAFPRQYIERKFCHQCRQYAGKSDRPHSRWRSVRALGIGSRSDFEHRLLYRISHYGNIYTYSIYPP